MKIRKAFAILVSTAILGTQLWAILPPGRAAWKAWYWPFMDYPMYAEARRPGDLFVRHRLTATPCEAGPSATLPEAEGIGAGHLRLKPFRLNDLLRQMSAPYTADAGFRERLSVQAPEATEEATRLVLGLVRSQPPTRYCRVQLQEHVLVLGEPLPRDPEALWRPLHEWEIGDEAEDSLARTEDLPVAREGRVRP